MNTETTIESHDVINNYIIVVRGPILVYPSGHRLTQPILDPTKNCQAKSGWPHFLLQSAFKISPNVHSECNSRKLGKLRNYQHWPSINIDRGKLENFPHNVKSNRQIINVKLVIATS